MTSNISPAAVGLLNRSSGLDLKYADAANKVGGEKRLLEQASKATQAMMGVRFEKADAVVAGSAGVRPQLAAPGEPVAHSKQDAGARFVQLMAQVLAVVGDSNLGALENRIAMRSVMAEGVTRNQAALHARYEAALGDLEDALANAGKSEAALESALGRLDQARQTLAAAQAHLDSLNPGDDGYDQALAARDNAQSAVTLAQNSVHTAKSAHEAALSQAQAANVKADGLLNGLGASTLQGHSVLEAQRKKNLDAASAMVLLMAKFAELIGESAEKRQEVQQQLAAEIRDAQAAVGKRKAEENEEAMRKAEEANKRMGCIGKILGAVLTVVSVVGAAFTGGASLAIAAVGLALMAGDMIGKAVTGVSFMEKAMKPLMDHVLAPVISAVGKAIASGLESVGVSAEKAAMIGNITGAIVGALLMVAAIVVVTVVGKGAASRIAPKLGEMLGKVAGKMVPDLLKDVGRSAGRMISQLATKVRSSVGLSSDAASLAKYGSRLEMSMAAAEGAGATAQSAMQIQSAAYQRQAAERMAEAVVANSIVESMAIWLQDQVQQFGEAIDKQTRVIEQIAAEMLNSQNTSVYIARHV